MWTFKNISTLSGFVFVGLLIGALKFDISFGWAVLVFLFWLGSVAWGSLTIQSGYFVKTYNSGNSHNEIVLTFDDGPHPETLQVLQLLEKYQAKATFFCIGKQIEKHPDIFKKIIENGHTVGNHSYSHSNYFGFFSSKKVKAELEKTDALIKKHSGKQPKFFRPPFGVTNIHIQKALQQTGHHTIGWDIRSLDTVIKSEKAILKRIISRLSPGSIVLLHDTSQKTVNVLEQLLIHLQRENYEMVSVDALLKIQAYEKHIG